jgi:hypothetical protein
MSLSRRQLLSVFAATTVLAACSGGTSRDVVNVRNHGATGDGKADDSKAIHAAVAALKPGSTLLFPSGSYRFAEQSPAAGAAIVIAGMSDVTVEFDSGAELVMDNLDSADGTGTSHGILIRGPGSGITLRNIRIRWAGRPSRRSMGDGIRIVGYPSDSGPPAPGWTASGGGISDVNVVNCELRSCPQAGVIMIGVSDIKVADLRVQDTMADGLHFNACRRATIDNHTAINTGDDGLALVTYFADTFAFDADAQTFSFPALTDWSDADFTVTNVTVAGGRANGVRLAGANRVEITGLNVSGVRSGAAVITDSAAAGVDTGWKYVASREIRLNKVFIDDCHEGIHLLARPNAVVDQRFTDFDVDVSEATIHGCANWSVRAESLAPQRTTGLKLHRCTVESTSTAGGYGGVSLSNTQNTNLGTISIRHAYPVLGFAATNSGYLVVDDLQVVVTYADQLQSPPPPCVIFENADGTINAMEVRWLRAPGSWAPFRVTNGALVCGQNPAAAQVVIRTLTTDPPTMKAIVSGC